MTRSESILRTAVVAVCALCACIPPQSGVEDVGASLGQLITASGGVAPGGQVLAAPAPRPPAATQIYESEFNNDYSSANLVTVNESVQLHGAMAAGATVLDRDFFEIGPAAAGDRIQADLLVNTGADTVLGLFDDRERLLGYIDPSSPAAGPAHLDVWIREPAERLYLVVASRSGRSAERAYTVKLSVVRGLAVPAPQPQVLVLNFWGAQGVRVGSRSAVDIPAFDAARIEPRFGAYSSTIVENVLQMVREQYSGLGLSVHLAGDPGMPAGPRSTVYFGTYDSRLLGLADNIDPYNSNQEQVAVVFTDTFSIFKPLSPDVEAISQVLANVAAHEAGHLIGLRHTADPYDTMDTTATARQMLLPQSFRMTYLNQTVISLGLQDAPSMLAWILGGWLDAPNGATTGKLAARAKAIALASKGIDFYVPRWQLMGCSCPDCGPEHEHAGSAEH